MEGFICGTCADATVQLNGTTVGTVASGATDSFTVNLDGSPSGSWDGTAWQVTSAPCDDATIELNGVEMTTIPSGDTENISVRQSSGATEVGYKQGVHWRIDDSAISINGSPVADVKAEDSLDIDVTQGGSPVGSWNGSAWIVPPCPSAASVSLAVSSASVDFGDTVTLTATATGFTGTITYRFSVLNNLGTYVVIEQVGDNTYDYVCPFAGTFGLEVVALDGFGNSAVGFASLTVGTLEDKYAIDAAFTKEVVLVDDKVDEWTDITGNGNDASAPSATTRCYTTRWAGSSDAVGVYGENDDRLLSPLNINTSEVIIYGYFDFNDNSAQGNFNILGLLSANANINSSRYNILVTDDSAATREILVQVRTSSGAFELSESVTNGKCLFAAKYSSGQLRFIVNGTTTTIAVTGTLVGSGSVNYNLLNLNTGSWSSPFPFPLYHLGLKQSAITDADQDQLYADLLLKYPS